MKRYEPDQYYNASFMTEDPTGDWVSYEKYAKLVALLKPILDQKDQREHSIRGVVEIDVELLETLHRALENEQ